MEMDLEKQELVMQQEVKLIKNRGYILLKKFFSRKYIENLRKKAENIFQIQFDRFGYNDSFKNNMINLFENNNNVFINCGKIIQTGLLELYKLPLEEKLVEKIKELGIEYPTMCTRPVLFFNHPKLAKSKTYYKAPLHQDWSSMESSMNSLVVWVPLVDVGIENGTLVIYPESHKLGPLDFEVNGGFASVEFEGDAIRPILEIGDIAIFSTLLVHSSGDILDDSIRWSCHYRYTDMLETDYIKRGFPNPYIYKPTIQK